jgi:hypothetical protein
MPHIRTDNQPVTQITVIEPEPGKQAEASSRTKSNSRLTSRPGVPRRLRKAETKGLLFPAPSSATSPYRQ